MPLVHFKRGGFIESSHRIEATAVDAAGRLILAAERPGLRTFWRSGAKPFQIAPFVTGGGLERFGLSERELAVMVSSHSGDGFHIELVTGILAKLGLGPEYLACVVAQPLDKDIAREMYKKGEPYSPLHNDCSGKHSAMLGLALLRGAPLDGYIRPEHPVQEEMRAAVARAAGLAVADMEEGVDGCGVPTFRIPLYNMALAYARLSRPEAGHWGEGQAAMARIHDAMGRHPECVGGRGRFESELMALTGGRLIAKLGAEASFCIASCERGEGLVFKVVDGGGRALEHFGVRLLRRLEWITAAEEATLLERFSPIILNDHRQVVGTVEVDWD
ncbi:MAG: asparaginase [Negativicutes bacterium]|nr:asparaginase [Negativicutes bacterium]